MEHGMKYIIGHGNEVNHGMWNWGKSLEMGM